MTPIKETDTFFMSTRLVKVTIDGVAERVGVLRLLRKDKRSFRRFNKVIEAWDFIDARPRYMMFDPKMGRPRTSLYHFDYQSSCQFKPVKALEGTPVVTASTMLISAGEMARCGREWRAKTLHTLHMVTVVPSLSRLGQHCDDLQSLRDLVGKDAFWTQTSTALRDGQETTNMFIHCDRAETAVMAKLFFARAKPLVMRDREPVQ